MHSRILCVLVMATASVLSPAAMQAPPAKRLLFLTHAALYKHTSLGPAERAVTELGRKGGFDVTTVEGYKQDANDPVFQAHIRGGIRWALGLEN